MAVQPTKDPTFSISFTGLDFPVFGPYKFYFYGVMASMQGCAEPTLDPHLDTAGNIVTGGTVKAHCGVTASITWGINLPHFDLGIKFTGQVYVNMDPLNDGAWVSPSDALIAMFTQRCVNASNNEKDWQVLIRQRIEFGMTMGPLSITFADMWTQLLLDSSGAGTDVYISFRVLSVSSLASIFGDQYKWNVQDNGVEKMICDTLGKTTGIDKKFNPFCPNDFHLYTTKDIANVYITQGQTEGAAMAKFTDGTSATLKKVRGGWEMCLNGRCHMQACVLDSDCTEAGYSCYNVCSLWNKVCTPTFTCQRVLTGCLCGVTPFASYVEEAWTPESCVERGCKVDSLFQATAAEVCKGRGTGTKHCIEDTNTNDPPIRTFCDGPTPGSRRLPQKPSADGCFPSRATLYRCAADAECPDQARSSCVDGKCMCNAGFCPATGGESCVEKSSEPVKLAIPVTEPPGTLSPIEQEAQALRKHPFGKKIR
jgi:hypothetical protein